MPANNKNPDENNELQIYHQELESIFNGLKKSADFEAQLKYIQRFYEQYLNKTANKSKANAIIQEYKLLISIIHEVKNGTQSPEDALIKIKPLTSARQMNLIVHNVLTLCEILFWSTIAAASLIACASMGLPMILTAPASGLIISIATTTFLLYSLQKGLKCFEEFRSFHTINAEDSREQNLISFFKSPRPEEDVSEIVDNSPFFTLS